MTNHLCPLCDHEKVAHYFTDKKRDYLQCQQCLLVFVPPEFHLSTSNEKSEYDKHENQLEDFGYLTFLSRLAKPLLTDLINPDFANEFASRPAKSASGSDLNNILLNKKKRALAGLDFGCGPGPALAFELRRLGLNISEYDIYYADDKSLLNKQYDFITCTEVVEHFNRPSKEISQLINMIAPGGLLAIMTKLVIDKQRFANWHYKNDPTHISFFSQQTFEFVANKFGLTLEFVDKDVIFLKKPKS
ncbi:class I SAM-dependent methyltransferase [Psychrosphaera sp.]|nr:class I SAM-dependent methyltransferase [Psychrosphaera sp.]